MGWQKARENENERDVCHNSNHSLNESIKAKILVIKKDSRKANNHSIK